MSLMVTGKVHVSARKLDSDSDVDRLIYLFIFLGSMRLKKYCQNCLDQQCVWHEKG